MEKLSVIVPVYNKGKTLFNNLQIICDELESISPNHEIIVVNDGSRDNSEQEVSRFIQSPFSKKVNFFSYPMNAGKGFALTYGFSKSSGNPIVFIDGDLEIHPRQIKDYLTLFKNHDADIVIGSKRHPESHVYYPFIRRLYSRTYQTLIKLLFNLNISDTQVGLKVFRREVLKKVVPRLVIKAWAFDLELLVVTNHLGFSKIIEAPVELEYKFASSINRGAVKNILQDTLAIFYRKNLLKYYDRKIQ